VSERKKKVEKKSLSFWNDLKNCLNERRWFELKNLKVTVKEGWGSMPHRYSSFVYLFVCELKIIILFSSLFSQSSNENHSNLWGITFIKVLNKFEIKFKKWVSGIYLVNNHFIWCFYIFSAIVITHWRKCLITFSIKIFKYYLNIINSSNYCCK